jgi:hypothetical protein
MTLAERAAAIEKVVAVATRGTLPDLRLPLYVANNNIWQDDGDAIVNVRERDSAVYFEPAVAALIVTACNDAPALVADLVRENERLKGALVGIAESCEQALRTPPERTTVPVVVIDAVAKFARKALS